MFKHIIMKGAGGLAVLAMATLTLVGSASAAPATNLSFAASNDGASAGWSTTKGSAIDLTLGTSGGTYAEVVLHHLAAAAVSAIAEPKFVTNNYNAGSPRWYVTLSNGDTLWGYPPNSGLATDFAWAINNGNSYDTWAQVQGTEGSATVTGAYVIADGDQTAGTTNVITGLTFEGIHFN